MSAMRGAWKWRRRGFCAASGCPIRGKAREGKPCAPKLAHRADPRGLARTGMSKSFLLLFFKKEESAFQ
jgi:hypothetical protein